MVAYQQHYSVCCASAVAVTGLGSNPMSGWTICLSIISMHALRLIVGLLKISVPLHLTSGVCVCCLASNGTNLYGMMMYGG